MVASKRVVGCVLAFISASNAGPPASSQPTQGTIEQRAWSMLSDGSFFPVERLLADYCAEHPRDADALFLLGVVSRAHFDVRTGDTFLADAARLAPGGIDGQAAEAVVAIDAGRNPAGAFDRLRTLIHQNPGDPALLWLGAITGRTTDSNEEAVRYFYALGGFFKVGPSLFHQTFANVLEQLKRYDEALPHRELAVRLDPSGWSYDGLGNTLSGLKRYADADAAGAKAVELDPSNWRYWDNYGNTAWRTGRFVEAETRYRTAIGLNAGATTTRFWLADAIERQGNLTGALKEFESLAKIRPAADVRRRIDRLRTKLGRTAEPPAATTRP